jgi:hypothetical protein
MVDIGKDKFVRNMKKVTKTAFLTLNTQEKYEKILGNSEPYGRGQTDFTKDSFTLRDSKPWSKASPPTHWTVLCNSIATL